MIKKDIGLMIVLIGIAIAFPVGPLVGALLDDALGTVDADGEGAGPLAFMQLGVMIILAGIILEVVNPFGRKTIPGNKPSAIQ
jgi:hypothetical protein